MKETCPDMLKSDLREGAFFHEKTSGLSRLPFNMAPWFINFSSITHGKLDNSQKSQIND